MIPIFVIAGVFVALFLGSFFSKRRFGFLGLALAAGATLSTIWDYDAGLLLSSTGLVPNGPLTQAVTLSTIVLLPALLLFFHGQKYHKVFPRIIGSLLFASLGLAFLIEAIGYALPLEGLSATVYAEIVAYKGIIISVGLVAAIVDLFFTKPGGGEKSGKK